MTGTLSIVLGERTEALGEIWHVPNAEAVTARQCLTLAFQLAGHSPKISSIGKLMMCLGGLFIPEAREVIEMMYEFEHPFVVDHSKYAQAFGDHATTLETGIQRTLDWYCEYLKQEVQSSASFAPLSCKF